MSKPVKKNKLNRVLPWRLVYPPRKYAFSEEVFGQIAEAYGVSHENVVRLAINLVHPLSLNFRPRGISEMLYQKKHGVKSRSSAIQKLKSVQKDLKDISALVGNLTIYGDRGQLGTLPRIDALNATLPKMLQDVSEALHAFENSERNQESIYDQRAVNNRRDADERRPAVLNQIFCFWEEQGRSLTATTRDNESQTPRGGALYDFAREIVLKVTDPPTALNSETFRSDLTKVRNNAKLHKLTVSKYLSFDWVSVRRDSSD